jgi:hypothetical protein
LDTCRTIDDDEMQLFGAPIPDLVEGKHPESTKYADGAPAEQCESHQHSLFGVKVLAIARS